MPLDDAREANAFGRRFGNSAATVFNNNARIGERGCRRRRRGGGGGGGGGGGEKERNYYKDEEKTAATFKLIDGVRYVLPGDAGVLEEDGTVTLLGRGSVCINTGGEKVFPEEVEEGLKAHEAIFDAVVVGLADERWGQRVTALVQLRDSMSMSEEDVIVHARSKVAGYKCPKQVFFVEQVPRHATGKPDYKTAQRRAGELAGE